MVVIAVVAVLAVVIVGFTMIQDFARTLATHQGTTSAKSTLVIARGALAREVNSASTINRELTLVTAAPPAGMSPGLLLALTNSEHALASAITDAHLASTTAAGIAARTSAVNAAVASAGVAIDQIGPEYQAASAAAIAAAPVGNPALVRALTQSVAVLQSAVKSRFGLRNAIDVVTSRMKSLARTSQQG